MAEKIRQVLCPTCRAAILDSVYYRHSKECQKKAAAKAAAQGKR